MKEFDLSRTLQKKKQYLAADSPRRGHSFVVTEQVRPLDEASNFIIDKLKAKEPVEWDEQSDEAIQKIVQRAAQEKGKRAYTMIGADFHEEYRFLGGNLWEVCIMQHNETKKEKAKK